MGRDQRERFLQQVMMPGGAWQRVLCDGGRVRVVASCTRVGRFLGKTHLEAASRMPEWLPWLLLLPLRAREATTRRMLPVNV